jgi:hypothetical protein
MAYGEGATLDEESGLYQGEDGTWYNYGDTTSTPDAGTGGVSDYAQKLVTALGGAGTDWRSNYPASSAISSPTPAYDAMMKKYYASLDPNYGRTGSASPKGSSSVGLSPSSGLTPKSIPMIDTSSLKYESPIYKSPKFNEGRVGELVSKNAMSGRSQLRTGLIGAINKVSGMSDSPIAQKYALGKVFESFGTGIAKNEQQAENAATSQYNTEYARSVDEAKTNYLGDVSEAEKKYNLDYQTLLNNYNTQKINPLGINYATAR